MRKSKGGASSFENTSCSGSGFAGSERGAVQVQVVVEVGEVLAGAAMRRCDLSRQVYKLIFVGDDARRGRARTVRRGSDADAHDEEEEDKEEGEERSRLGLL
eukprot:GHVT01083073.1.p1 GENE.GHVT01083073.1~~GHVT01083073.1.p1  ORF type:complete len:102 (+),score=20.45 GHVT01083073.1:105-410(+)